MADTFVIGKTVAEALGGSTNRYFYGLKVDEEGTLYFGRVDITSSDDLIIFDTIPPDDLSDISIPGDDFFDGKDPDTHEVLDPSLRYQQFRWDSRLISYYLDADGVFSAIIGSDRSYPTDV